MAIDARNRSLPDWFTRIRTRQTVLPRFQRFEAWSHDNITQVLNTVLKGLPLGAVLVLEIGDEEPFVSRSMVGAPTEGERITEHLLDGQQRLTGLWRGLTNDYDDRTYFLSLASEESEAGVAERIFSVGRWRKDKEKERRPFWADDPKQLWQRRLIPLHLCAPDATDAFNDWKRLAIESGEEREEASDRISMVRQKFATFNLPYLALPVSTQKETALDVFIKMNTSAAALKTYDIVVAQIEAGAGTSLHDRVGEIREECPGIDAYYPPEDLALAVSALLQGRQPTNSTFLSKDFGPQMLENWDRLLSGIAKAVVFLEEEKIFDAQRLPSDPVVPVLVALWAEAPEGLDAEGRVRSALRRYVWRAFFTNRYEMTTGFRSFTDYNELKRRLAEGAGFTPVIFDEEQYPLPHQTELIAANWPKRRDRLARAILAMALKQGGLDLADGSAVSRSNLTRREYHHLFPDAHLQRLGFSDRAYRSLNCALVTWRTNRNISDKEPERYLAERLQGTDLGEAEIRARLESHLIPYDAMVAGDYDAFLTARAERVHTAMLKACAGGAGAGGG